MTTRGGARSKNGNFYANARYGRGKRLEIRVPWATTEEHALERGRLIAKVADELVAIGRPDLVRGTARQLAEAATADRLAKVQKAIAAILKGAHVAPGKDITFEQWANRYTSGELARLYPDTVKAINHKDNLSRLRKYIFPHVADVPIVAFDLSHAQAVMAKLPPMTEANRRQVAQIMGRVLHLAVNPGRLIAASPLPRGWMPKVKRRKAYSFLFPREESQLLGCEEISEAFRLFCGVLDREGMRISELLDSEWSQWNLREGTFGTRRTKTDDPRFWALSTDVHAAMQIWREKNPDLERPFAYVTALLDGDKKKLAKYFRASLKAAGVDRAELFEKTEHTARLRAHDMRATFVTISLAQGKSEVWIRDRTAHKSTAMIDRYRRSARQVEELKLGPLPDLVQALGWWKGGGKAAGDPPIGAVEVHGEVHGTLVGSSTAEPKWRNGRRSGLKICSADPSRSVEAGNTAEDDVSKRLEKAFHHPSTTPFEAPRDSENGIGRGEEGIAHSPPSDRPGPARAVPREGGDAGAVSRARRAAGELVWGWDLLEEQAAAFDRDGES